MNIDGSNPVNLTNHPAKDLAPSCFRFEFDVLSTSVSPRDRLVTIWRKMKRGNR